MAAETPVLECKDLCISYFTRAGEIPAVVDFNLTVMPGEAVGIVGESGCGKSTVALAIMQYLGKSGRIMSGEIRFKGRDMNTMSEKELRQLRGSQIAMVYQEPMASLNPSMSIARQLMEVPRFHDNCSEQEAYARALEMLGSVRLPDPKRIMESYPHQISGGQQQRVVIAMALLSNPALLLLDEPTTALDVTVEAGIVELIKEISERFGTSMIYISHNLGLILETCDRITVMYSGEAVELGTVEEVFDQMRHPYTKGLFNSIPLPGADKNARPLGADPRPAAAAARAPRGLQLRAALRALPRRRVRPWPHRHGSGAGTSGPHDPLPPLSRDRLEPRARGDRRRRGHGARTGRAPGRESEEVLRAQRQLGDGADPRRRGAHGQGQREARFRRARGRDRGDRRRVGLRQVHLRQGPPRPRDRDRRQGRARQPGPEPGAGAEAAPAGGESPADDFPEPVRHPQPQPQRGRADRARDQEIRRRERPREGARARDAAARHREIAARLLLTAGRASCRAARSSGSALRGRSPAIRAWWSPTSRSRRSTSRCRPRSPSC